MFKRRFLTAIREGRKVQTRRTHRRWRLGKTYMVRTSYTGQPEGYIKITCKFQQRLGDISTVDVQKEGFSSLEDFKQDWLKISGYWNPEQVITVYEFIYTQEKGK